MDNMSQGSKKQEVSDELSSNQIKDFNECKIKLCGLAKKHELIDKFINGQQSLKTEGYIKVLQIVITKYPEDLEIFNWTVKLIKEKRRDISDIVGNRDFVE